MKKNSIPEQSSTACCPRGLPIMIDPNVLWIPDGDGVVFSFYFDLFWLHVWTEDSAASVYLIYLYLVSLGCHSLWRRPSTEITRRTTFQAFCLGPALLRPHPYTGHVKFSLHDDENYLKIERRKQGTIQQHKVNKVDMHGNLYIIFCDI